MTVAKWENFGDVNPIEHGGIFVKYDSEIGGRCFYVVQIQMDEDVENQWLMIDGYIDLDDSWLEWEDIKDSCDTPENASDSRLVVDALYYYGSHLSNGEVEKIEGEKAVRERLENMGIEVQG